MISAACCARATITREKSGNSLLIVEYSKFYLLGKEGRGSVMLHLDVRVMEGYTHKRRWRMSRKKFGSDLCGANRVCENGKVSLRSNGSITDPIEMPILFISSFILSPK